MKLRIHGGSDSADRAPNATLSTKPRFRFSLGQIGGLIANSSALFCIATAFVGIGAHNDQGYLAHGFQRTPRMQGSQLPTKRLAMRPGRTDKEYVWHERAYRHAVGRFACGAELLTTFQGCNGLIRTPECQNLFRSLAFHCSGIKLLTFGGISRVTIRSLE